MSKRLEKLLEKQEQLKNLVKLERSRHKDRERKALTRKKVLLDSLFMAMMEEDETLRANVDRRLEGFLHRRVDREVFGLSGGTGPSGGHAPSEAEPDKSAA